MIKRFEIGKVYRKKSKPFPGRWFLILEEEKFFKSDKCYNWKYLDDPRCICTSDKWEYDETRWEASPSTKELLSELCFK